MNGDGNAEAIGREHDLTGWGKLMRSMPVHGHVAQKCPYYPLGSSSATPESVLWKRGGSVLWRAWIS
ncbi:hypothetical protein ACM1RC_03645 [Paenibacillus azoreducens]|uniref:hypothetical protein n=1 Tax=Paenibacillus azoreducens TaxID=116718 RepID=UPI0039F5FEDE